MTGDGLLSALVALVYLAALVAGDGAPAAVRTLPLAGRVLPALRLTGATALVVVGGLLISGTLPLAGAAGALLTALAVLLLVRRGPQPAERGTRVLIVGTASEADDLHRTLTETGAGGFRIVGATTDLDRLDATIAATGAQLLVHTDHLPRPTVLAALVRPDRHVPALGHGAFCELALGIVPLSSLDDAWLAELLHPTRFRRADLARRALDLALALLTLPFVLLVVALSAPLILLDGERSVFFRQRRVGRYGVPFEILKLRTMRGSGSDWSAADDPRITRIGAFLRRTHLDEVPQILNVLRGQMAFVGPRPEQVEITAWLEGEIPGFGHRHAVRPGITGWARVRAGYANSVRDSAVKLSNDLYYIRHRSLALDLAVVVETIRMFAERQHQVVAPATAVALGPRLALRLADAERAPAAVVELDRDEPALDARAPVAGERTMALAS
ncbi:sugar transferase [Patulibacter defluvii]|uniref:sugar transferase n=1 Tax=Patulibacter defluvii TaxID=3095358 RepID=UPI002A75E68D|nr:sugar transferase [Patulibacter sp. DM4]